MEKAKIAKLQPAKVKLEKGRDYYWCVCGRSQHQPFCDGSHQGTGFTPKQFSVSKDQEVYLCQCKQTQQPPFCDGSHNKLCSPPNKAS